MVLELVWICRQARIFTFSSFPSIPWHVNFHPLVPLALYLIFCSNCVKTKHSEMSLLISLLYCSSSCTGNAVRGGAACGGGCRAVLSGWRYQCMCAGALESCSDTRRQTASLPKDFYSLASSWSRREKRKANQTSSRRAGQQGHSLTEVVWKGLNPVDKFQVMYLSREHQISDLHLTVSELRVDTLLGMYLSSTLHGVILIWFKNYTGLL